MVGDASTGGLPFGDSMNAGGSMMVSRNTRSYPWHLLWLVFGGVLLLSPVQAQEALPGVFGEVIDVRVINLEIVVTDRQGVRVAGLPVEEFVLEVDGREVPIDYFTEVLGGQAVRRAEGASEVATGGLAGVPQLAPGEPVGTSYLLFIDDFFSIAKDRDAVLRGLMEDLPVLGPQDRMAVVAFDGRRLSMLTTWSRSEKRLTDALQEAERRPAYGLQRVAERRSALLDRETLDGIGGRTSDRFGNTGRLDIDEEAYTEQLSEQVEGMVSAAIATLRSFAAPPGRKVMLVLSGGWPFAPASFTVGDNQRLVYDQDLMGGPQLFRSFADTANRLGYTLYPVDVPGLISQALDDEADVGPNAGFRRDFVREQEIHASLNYLAAETGGVALLDSVRLDVLPRVYEDTRSYYWLGFTPDWEGDDGVHEIRVKVRGERFKVRAREGFQDLSRSSEVTMMVESALLFGNSPSPLPLGLELGKARKAGRGKSQISLTIYVPVDHVTILPRSGSGPVEYVAQLDLRIAAIDAEGRRSEIPVIPLEVSGPEPPTAGHFLRYDTEVTLRRTKQELLVAVYDPVSGNLMSAGETVDLARRR
jgi:VWFA-related protein